MESIIMQTNLITISLLRLSGHGFLYAGPAFLLS